MVGLYINRYVDIGLPSNSEVLQKFFYQRAEKENSQDSELMKYQIDYICDDSENLSMHQLVLEMKEKSCEELLRKLHLTEGDIFRVETETRDQY